MNATQYTKSIHANNIRAIAPRITSLQSQIALCRDISVLYANEVLGDSSRADEHHNEIAAAVLELLG